MSQVPDWNDAQIKRFQFRSALFSRRGLSTQDAEALADKLAVRDFERDERRACVECESIQRGQRGTTCFKRLPVLPTQLMRCNGFTFQKP